MTLLRAVDSEHMDMELLTHAGVDDVSPHGSFEEAGAAVAAEHAVVLP